MNITLKIAFFNLSKDGSIQYLVKPYYDGEEIIDLIKSGAYNYLCDIYSNKRRFWYLITDGGKTTLLPEKNVPNEFLATVLLMED